MDNILFLDVETTTWNKGHPFDGRNFCVCYTLINDSGVHFRHYTDPDFRVFLREAINKASYLCGFNIKFDLHWIRNLGIAIPPLVKVWDCQLAEFVYSGQTLPYDSLEAALERYSIGPKSKGINEYWEAGINTDEVPIKVLEERCTSDTTQTRDLFFVQQRLLSEKQKRLVLLEGDDLKALQDAEYNGIKFDYAKADEKLAAYNAELAKIEQQMLGFLPEGLEPGWFNFDSGDHMSALLYGGEIKFDYSIPEESVYKSGPQKGQAYTRNRWYEKVVAFPQRFKPLEGTEVAKTAKQPDATTRFYQVDAPTLSQLKTRSKESKLLLQLLSERAGKIKVVEMVNSIKEKAAAMNWSDGCIHGQFNQQVVVTGRLSSSAPNLQNTPPEVDELLVSRYD